MAAGIGRVENGEIRPLRKGNYIFFKIQNSSENLLKIRQKIRQKFSLAVVAAGIGRVENGEIRPLRKGNYLLLLFM